MAEPPNPNEITDDILLAYLEGDVPEEVARHISRSPHLAARARQLSEEIGTLQKSFFRAACPTPDSIGDFYLKLLPAKEVPGIHAHLSVCPFCARELAIFRTRLGPPLEREPSPGFFESITVWLADLVKPGLQGAPALAFRGEAQSMRVYGAGTTVVTLDVQPEDNSDTFSLMGTVAGLTGDRVEAMLWHEERLIDTMPITRGSFRADGLETGAYEVLVRSGDTVFFIADLTLP